MERIKLIVLISFVVALFIGCDDSSDTEDIPSCIKELIDNSNDTCLSAIYSYKYNGDIVYFLTFPCPEGCFSLIDENCNTINDIDNNPVCYCNFGGAFCSDDFWENRTDEKLIWSITL